MVVYIYSSAHTAVYSSIVAWQRSIIESRERERERERESSDNAHQAAFVCPAAPEQKEATRQHAPEGRSPLLGCGVGVASAARHSLTTRRLSETKKLIILPPER